MWDTAVEIGTHVSRDAPCMRCGHAMHTFLPCSDSCDCSPPVKGIGPAATGLLVTT